MNKQENNHKQKKKKKTEQTKNAQVTWLINNRRNSLYEIL